MCCLCLHELYMTLVLKILRAITDVHHQAGLLLAYTQVLQTKTEEPRCVVTFGFEHGMQTKLRQCS